jgi:hypothetical protein
MSLADAVDAIREKLVQHRRTGRNGLWATIVKQIAKQNAFDGAYVDTILEVIRSLVRPLDAATIISLWRETEVGMGDETEDERFDPDDLRMDLEMELLKQITDLARDEAQGR